MTTVNNVHTVQNLTLVHVFFLHGLLFSFFFFFFILNKHRYRCYKNVSICNATNGELLCEERPIYGGTGHVNKKFDEPGYILQPPCLWGDSEYGLESPVDVDPSKYVLGSVKTSNATYGHHGEMAWQQMYLVPSL